MPVATCIFDAVTIGFVLRLLLLIFLTAKSLPAARLRGSVRFCKKTKLYSCNARRFRKIVDSVEAKSVPLEKIAEKTLSILGSRHPRFAYGINRNFLLRLYAVCPAEVKFWAVGRILAEK